MAGLAELQSYYDENAAQARQHEDQRERATSLILTIAGLLVGLITFAKLSCWSLPAAICIVLLGAFGFLFAGKHYERSRFHTAIMEKIRVEIEKSEANPKSLSELREEGEKAHYDHFVWPTLRGSHDELQRGAKYWIARQRLHVFWECVHLLVVVIGVGMCLAILVNGKIEPKPIKVEIVSPTPSVKVEMLSPAATPSKAEAPK
jgi:xanthosine utilization system XapX-like protein